MLTFFVALCQKLANPPSLKLFFSAIIDDVETVSADLQRANIGNMKKINNHVNPMNLQHAHHFAALHQNLLNSSSLKFLISAIIDDAETVGADLQRAYVGDMKKFTSASIP